MFDLDNVSRENIVTFKIDICICIQTDLETDRQTEMQESQIICVFQYLVITAVSVQYRACQKNTMMQIDRQTYRHKETKTNRQTKF